MSLVAALQPGMLVVDVGANLGSMTTQYQQAGAEVWAIEPDPRCWRDLSQFVDAQHLLGLALGDHEGVALLHRSEQAAHNSLAEANVLDPGTASLHVPLSTLDALQAQGRLPARIDAVKIDAQGSEVAILRGAAHLLRTQAPIWYVEIWAQGLAKAGASVESLCAVFQDAGYVPDSYAGGRGGGFTELTWDVVCAMAHAATGHGSIDVLIRKAA